MNKSIVGFIVLFASFSCQERGIRSVPIIQPSHQKEEYSIKDSVHFLQGYPAMVGDSLINVVVEIPTGTLEKWEVNKENGYLELPEIDGIRRVVDYLGYPGNYGMVPQSLQDAAVGGDGDPLDILILGPPLSRGSLVKCRIIGIIRMLDNGELDDKLIALPAKGYLENIRSMENLEADYPGIIEILTLWFENYKGKGQVEIKSIGEKEEAFQVLQEAIEAYQNQR
ncbi:inorganic diphosphatase [Aquiflexum gelatinilyticum]|uniref:inorganic diphosphatase n=1 Tax=Aquiflexum gelatinilyticum TaxID=2961943 RepID=A0A9X2PA00_9BACT|nr:inorganic diphosphatase [Aquiflexum gelatinilyticum]MCR9016560.1 inorganic diphosphatase [Aquiflexum gelatinilyticum]